MHVFSKVPVGDFKAVAFYHWGIAVGANRVFPRVPGDVADVDVVEALVFRGEICLLHLLHASCRYGGHFVFGMETQQVKGCVGSQVILYPLS